ncbi:hypothetical protein [Novosphingobium sp.]|uniref:hypothetical protein n=1 Tax=Novosphingobium sp. TaxID=1874826 RepID=UPI003D09B7DF
MKGVWTITVSAVALIASAGGGASALAQAAPGGAGLSYNNATAVDDTATAPDGTSASASSASDGAYTPPLAHGNAQRKHKRTKIIPYLEVDQTVYDQVTPHQPFVTYTTVAAGVDVQLNDKRTTGFVSLRYEHHFDEAGGIGNSDTFTGILRTTTTIIPRTLTFDVGGLATRTSIEQSGGVLINPIENQGSIYQIYSIYGGPSLSTHAGIVGIKAAYNVGYNEIDQIYHYAQANGGAQPDLFGHSLTQQGTVSAGVRPGAVLPFGVTLIGSYLKENINSLDQQLIDERAGVEFTQPISRAVALVADIGWEKVAVSQRNAEFDGNGIPILAANGQYAVDRSQPRQIAYKTDGLTWDVGVVWHPSKRTMAAAYVGRRYDSTTYYGSLFHAPDSRQTLSASVYDGIYGFGSGLMTALQQVPTDSTVVRDPFSGNVGGCYTGSTAGGASPGGGCVTGALGSANALVFRSRGFNAAYGLNVGRLNFSVGGGYTTRRYIAAPDTILASENGKLDQTWYVDAGISGPIDRQTRFYVSAFGSIYHTDTYVYGGTADWGVSGSLVHHLTDRLVATGSFEVMGVNPQISQDQLETLGQLGLRYNFR